MVEYAIYKGDKFIASGTARELAKKFEVNEDTIRFLATPTNIKRDRGNRMIAIRLED